MASFLLLALQGAIKFTSRYRTILENTRSLSVISIWISFPISQLTYEVEVYNYPLAIFDVACSQVYSIHISVDRGREIFPNWMQSWSITRKPAVRRGQP